MGIKEVFLSKQMLSPSETRPEEGRGEEREEERRDEMTGGDRGKIDVLFTTCYGNQLIVSLFHRVGGHQSSVHTSDKGAKQRGAACVCLCRQAAIAVCLEGLYVLTVCVRACVVMCSNKPGG